MVWRFPRLDPRQRPVDVRSSSSTDHPPRFPFLLAARGQGQTTKSAAWAPVLPPRCRPQARSAATAPCRACQRRKRGRECAGSPAGRPAASRRSIVRPGVPRRSRGRSRTPSSPPRAARACASRGKRASISAQAPIVVAVEADRGRYVVTAGGTKPVSEILRNPRALGLRRHPWRNRPSGTDRRPHHPEDLEKGRAVGVAMALSTFSTTSGNFRRRKAAPWRRPGGSSGRHGGMDARARRRHHGRVRGPASSAAPRCRWTNEHLRRAPCHIEHPGTRQAGPGSPRPHKAAL